MNIRAVCYCILYCSILCLL